jgi:adenylate cyclase
MSIAAGARIGPYEILASLGAGGMGEVYRARDAHLGRDVALKILPVATASDPVALERFMREAQTLAALNHPHIVTIYSTEETDGIRFIAMELVEGRTLDRVIPASGVSLAQFFDISIGMADALAAAHQKQITHRDFKPGNVMLTDTGRVKVLDFGLARTVVASMADADEATRAALTGQGTILGTTAYMSPEQIESKPLDGRSDLFALGVVMYELLTGERPFRGDSSPAVMAAVIKDRPKLIGEVRGQVPIGVSRLVERCLEKNPRDRPQSAQEVLLELKALKTAWETRSAPASPRAPAVSRLRRILAVATAVLVLAGLAGGGWIALNHRGAQPEGKPTVAVLPFTDMSEGKDQGYFSDGVSEDILNVLSRMPELRVTSRSSAFSFKDRNVEVSEIAKGLNVGHVLEGSVKRSGNAVRITATLVDARMDAPVWTETFDRTLDDVLAVQDEIAYAVARQLRRTLVVSDLRPRKVNGRAYDLYLQALEVRRQSRPDRDDEMQRLLKEALAIDPDFAQAWAALGSAFLNDAMQGMSNRKPADLFGLARDASRRASVIDPNIPWPYATLARVAEIADHDPQLAARYLERGLALAPTDANLLINAANLLLSLGRVSQAVAVGEYVLTLDPLNSVMQFNLGSTYELARRYDDAIAASRRSLAISPKRTVAHYVIGEAMLMKHDGAGALAEFEQEPSDVWKAAGRPMALYAVGREAEANAALSTLIEKYEAGSSYNIARVYALRGASEEAFAWLDKAVTYRDPGVFTTASDPLLETLHGDRRWLPLLRKIGNAPDQLAAVTFTVRIPSP